MKNVRSVTIPKNTKVSVSNEPGRIVLACNHKRSEVGYLEWHAWAERLDAQGIKQLQCPVCELWLWPEELCE